MGGRDNPHRVLGRTAAGKQLLQVSCDIRWLFRGNLVFGCSFDDDREFAPGWRLLDLLEDVRYGPSDDLLKPLCEFSDQCEAPVPEDRVHISERAINTVRRLEGNQGPRKLSELGQDSPTFGGPPWKEADEEEMIRGKTGDR